MKRTTRACVAVVLAAFAAGSGTAWACTASMALDTAKNTQDTAAVQTARDVATMMADAEGWPKDSLTIDAGAGTLIMEKNAYDQMGLAPTWTLEWLNSSSGVGGLDFRSTTHGLTSDRQAVGNTLTSADGSFQVQRRATVLEHARLHLAEVGTGYFYDPWRGVTTYPGYERLFGRPLPGGSIAPVATAPTQTTTPSTTTAPVAAPASPAPSAEPEPVAAPAVPEPIIHHAG